MPLTSNLECLEAGSLLPKYCYYDNFLEAQYLTQGVPEYWRYCEVYMHTVSRDIIKIVY